MYKYLGTVFLLVQVRTWRMNFYTVIQLFCFLVVCVIKLVKKTAWTFPFAILGAVAVRHWLVSRLFDDTELQAVGVFRDLIVRN